MSNYTVVKVENVVLDEKRFEKFKEIVKEYFGKVLNAEVSLEYFGTVLYIHYKHHNVRGAVAVSLTRDGRLIANIPSYNIDEFKKVSKAITESAIAADYIVSAEEAGFLVENIEFLSEEKEKEVELGVL